MTNDDATPDTEAQHGRSLDGPSLDGPSLDDPSTGEQTPDGLPSGEQAPDGQAPLEEVVVPRTESAVLPLGPLGLAGTAVVGFGMGAADLVPGFSGGTVAFVGGIYTRLIGNVRQGARVLSLLVRGRPKDAWRALLQLEWPFVASLLGGVLVAIFTLASLIQRLLVEHPTLMSAVFLGLVLGACVVSSRELRAPAPIHPLIGIVVAAVTFWGLGYTSATTVSPSLLFVFVAGAVAICAMILPGLSGSFILLLLGVYAAIIDAVVDRDLLVLGVFAAGCVVGLASFATLLNHLLRRYHDVVLAALIGLMAGSARVLWPWPEGEGVGDPTLGAPEGDDVFLAIALALAAFGAVYIVGLVASAVARRRARREEAPPAIEG